MAVSGGIKLNDNQLVFISEKLGVPKDAVKTASLKELVRIAFPDFPPDLPRGGNKRKKK